MAAALHCIKGDVSCPITSLEFSRDGSLLFSGMGPFLHIIDPMRGDLLASDLVMDGRSVHGLRYGIVLYISSCFVAGLHPATIFILAFT